MTESEIQTVIDRIVQRIASRFHPEKILLFGSYARGTATADSDADLLVIMNVTSSRRQQAVEIDLALEGIPIPTDILVVTPNDIASYHNRPDTVIGQALREGKVLYERAA